ncbi:MAG: hypothetical protein J2P57_01445 [Acidimicrobiaceae bacterium]|nr:hypothetical protein [Acidimicrobiaceae bacterium]
MTHGQVIFQYNASFKIKLTGIPHGFNGKIFNITGWVTGLITLPTLQVSDATVVFCSQPTNGNPPPIHFVEQAGTSAQTQNWDPSGPGYFNFTIRLRPVGTPSLKVTAVGPRGALAIAGSAAAMTSVVAGPPFNQTCRSEAPTMLPNLATSLAPMPPGGQPVIPPSPLTGPLSHASATLGSDNFSVPAFDPASCLLANGLFNQGLAGLNKRGTPNWTCIAPTARQCPAVAAKPGWVQFSANTTLVSLGLPKGPPPGFNF